MPAAFLEVAAAAFLEGVALAGFAFFRALATDLPEPCAPAPPRVLALVPLFFFLVLLSELPPKAADALARAGLVVRLAEALPVEVLVFDVFFWVDVRRAAIWMYP